MVKAGKMKKTFATILLLAGIVSMAGADEPYDYGARWKAWDVYIRLAYVIGVEEGIVSAFFTTTTSLDKKPSREEQLRILDILKFGSGIAKKKIIEVITEIYQDPANSYIPTVKIFIMAQEKIEGKDISKSLENARRAAYDFHRLEQEIKQGK
jgi:hypothetical protein